MTEQISLEELNHAMHEEVKQHKQKQKILNEYAKMLDVITQGIKSKLNKITEALKEPVSILGLNSSPNVYSLLEKLDEMNSTFSNNMGGNPGNSEPMDLVLITGSASKIQAGLQNIRSIAQELRNASGQILIKLDKVKGLAEKLSSADPQTGQFGELITELYRVVPNENDADQVKTLLQGLTKSLNELQAYIIEESDTLRRLLVSLGGVPQENEAIADRPLSDLIELHQKLLNDANQKIKVLKDCLGDSYEVFTKAIFGKEEVTVEEALTLLSKIQYLREEGKCPQIQKFDKVKISL